MKAEVQAGILILEVGTSFVFTSTESKATPKNTGTCV